MLLTRPEKLSGDFVTCPYCRTKFHYDQWESFSYDLYEITNFVKNEIYRNKNTK